MKKILNGIQILSAIYIYGLAGMSDRGNISLLSLSVQVLIALTVIGIAQKKKSACKCH